MSHWSFADSSIVILAGIGVVALSAWLGWSNWQRNGRRGKVALLEALRFVAVAMLTFTLLRPEFVREITAHRSTAGRDPHRRLGEHANA